jgi:hypothetical protein
MTKGKKVVGVVAAVVLAAAGTVGALVLPGGTNGVRSGGSSVTEPFALGFYPNTSGSYSASEWSGLGITPSYLGYYACVPGSEDADPLQSSIDNGTSSAGMGLLIKMDDNCGVPGGLPSVANGSDDSYLTAFGKDLASLGQHVMLDYDWEQNASWNTYGAGGSGDIAPSEWIEAWNVFVTEISSTDNGLATFVWNPNAQAGSDTPDPVSDYWSDGGQTVKDVGAIGVDAYLCINQTTGSCSQTFNTDIEPSIVLDHAVDPSLPIFLAETGIGGTDRNTELVSLVDQAHAAGLTGIMYFSSQAELLTASEQASLGAAVAAINAVPTPTPTPSPSEPSPTPSAVPTVQGPVDVTCPNP